MYIIMYTYKVAADLQRAETADVQLCNTDPDLSAKQEVSPFVVKALLVISHSWNAVNQVRCCVSRPGDLRGFDSLYAPMVLGIRPVHKSCDYGKWMVLFLRDIFNNNKYV